MRFPSCKSDRRTFSLHYNCCRIFVFAIAAVLSVFVNSCICNSKLVCEIRQKEGLKFHGKISPWMYAFTFIPLSASSRHHIYDSLTIDYKNIKEGELDNINMVLLGKKLNLGSLTYDDVLDITPTLASNCDKFVGTYRNAYVSPEEWGDDISFVFGRHPYYVVGGGTYYYEAAARFYFEIETRKIRKLVVYIPLEIPPLEMNTTLKFENIEKSIEACFPLQEKDMLLIFGEDVMIYRDYSL